MASTGTVLAGAFFSGEFIPSCYMQFLHIQYYLILCYNKWIFSLIIWIIILNEVIFTNKGLPVVLETGFYLASSPFFHMNRTADFCVLIFVTQGVIFVTEDGNDYAVRPGELLFLKSGVNHFGRYEIPKGTRWYYVHFRVPENVELENCRVLPKQMQGLLESSIEKELAGIVERFHHKEEENLWEINADFWRFLTQLTRWGKKRAKLTLSDKICEFLSKKDGEPFDSAVLEKEFCLSYKRLAAVFKSQKNQTMQEYHRALKIQKAIRLLRTTLLNISEIAGECGYEDALYFSRVFKKQTGKSPSEFRRLPEGY